MATDLVKLPITVNENNFRPGIIDILKHVRPGWKEDDIRYKVFTDGLTNKLIGCHTGEFKDVVLVRIYGEKTDLIIDRKAECCNMQLLHDHERAEAIYCRFENGLCYGFIHGETLKDVDIQQDHVNDMIAKEMAYYHALRVPEMDSENQEMYAFKMIRKWMMIIPKEFPEPERDLRLKNEVLNAHDLDHEVSVLENVVKAMNLPLVFCHNDLLLNNVILTENKDQVKFIDYEYGALNPEAYDIGNHFCEYAGTDQVDYDRYPNEGFQKSWLRKYLHHKYKLTGKGETVTHDAVDQLYIEVNILALVAHFFWGIWALIQAKYSTVDFDYLNYGIMRFNEYFRRRSAFLALRSKENDNVHH